MSDGWFPWAPPSAWGRPPSWVVCSSVSAMQASRPGWPAPGATTASAVSPLGGRVGGKGPGGDVSRGPWMARSEQSRSETSLRRGNQVHDGEDHDPHDVDEVPVEAGDLHHLGLLLGQASP